MTENRPALLGTPGVASEVIGCLADVTNAELDRRLALLEVLIDEARMDKENRGRFGERFLSEAHDAIDALAGADNLDEGTAVLLAHAFARANLEAPGSLGSSIPVGLEEGDGVTRLPVDPDSLLDRIRDEAEDHVYGLHGALGAGLGVLPVEFRPDFVRYVAGRDDGSYGRLALYWMLDPVADIRLAAAAGVLERARRGALDPATAAPLPLIRSWMPADRARQVLDAALREARRRDLLGPIQRPAGQLERCLGTLPDGSGSQSFAIGLGGGAGPAVAMVLVKTGHGIKDAFVVSDEEGNGPNQIMTEMELEAGALDIPWETVPTTLAAALAEGLASGHPPSAGLLDVALACGLTGLRPRPMTPRDWLAEVDPEGEIAVLSVQKRGRLVNRSETWPDDHPIVETWYEGAAIFDEMLKEEHGPRQLEAALWAQLEARREVWTLTMMRAAHILKAAGRDAQWMSFAATVAGAGAPARQPQPRWADGLAGMAGERVHGRLPGAARSAASPSDAPGRASRSARRVPAAPRKAGLSGDRCPGSRRRRPAAGGRCALRGVRSLGGVHLAPPRQVPAAPRLRTEEAIMAFGNYVRAKRLELGIGLNDFAGRIGCSPAYWSRIERELEKPPSDGLIEKTAAVLGVRLDELFVEAARFPPDMRRDVKRVVRAYRRFRAVNPND